ncbi:MAG: T9SS type A sorting domain-containing protein [Flavobacteriales bacterium]|nr:T9SS type A sorting domain-containing protein [Flavobacteriales bacterium]
MRILTAFAVPFVLSSATHAQQTVNSVTDGDWWDPFTWDCSCVPGNTALVTVDHYVTLDGGMNKGGGSLTIGPGGVIDNYTVIQLGCKVVNYGYMVLEDLWIDADMEQFENLGIIDCYRIANYREDLYNDGYLMVIDTLYTYSSITNGPAGYFSAYAIKGDEEFENFNVADFSGVGSTGIRFFNHDTLEFHASAGSVARSIINDGYLVLHGLRVDTLLNEGTINSATITIGAYYSGAGEWLVMPVSQDIIVDTNSTMIITAPGRLNVSDGDLTVYGAMEGSGCVIVDGTTMNHGSITGTLDICDLSPTTTQAPILDVNTGTVSSGVTFCTSTACSVGFGPESRLSQITLFPNPANERVELWGLGSEVAEIRVFDLQGRLQVLSIQVAGPSRGIDVSLLTAGSYMVHVVSGAKRTVIPLVIGR